MPRFSDKEYRTILKTFYIYDSRLKALSTTLLQNALIKSTQTGSTKPLEKWVTTWKKCRLNIKKTYHKYGLRHAGDKIEIEKLFNLYLNDKKVAQLLSTASPDVLQVMTNTMAPRTMKLIIKHPPRGFAERIASRLADGFEQITLHQRQLRIHNKE